MTVAIAFNGGAYGTYLEWCLTTLTSSSDTCAPFTSKGNSHLFAGNFMLTFDSWNNYLASGKNIQFARIHPKTQQTDSLSANMDHLCNTASSVVYLYPDKNSILLCINNSFSKVWDNWWGEKFTSDIILDKIYNNWGVSHDIPFSKIPYWIRREFLSLNMMPLWFDQVEWYHPEKWSNKNCLVVTIDKLLNHFALTLEEIFDHIKISPIKPISELLPYHEQNLALQKYTTHDQLCANIVHSTISSTLLSWDPLSLPSEAWIQWELRNHGLEIRCDGLDTFPTNSIQLKELLYPI